MILIRLALVLTFLAPLLSWAAGEVDQSSYEAEDFEIQEEGMLFDPARTGLMYRRNVYEQDENRTFVSQQPSAYNDTTETRAWTVHITHWEVDPPSFINVFILDDTPYQYKEALVDLQVRIGQLDRQGNMITTNTMQKTDIPVKNGMNRVPLNIHNYAGDIVSIFITGARQKLPYHPIEFVGK